MNAASKIPTSLLLTLLILLLAAKAIGVALFWFLPLEGKDYQKRYSFAPDFIHIDLPRAFGLSKTSTASSPESPKLAVSSLILKGLYGNNKKGFALIAKRGETQKVKIIALGESFEGYTLSSIRRDGVILTKEGKEFLLPLEKVKNDKMQVTYNEGSVSANDETMHTVQNSDVEYFSRHPREIWKNISIQEKRKNGKIEGFEVKWIRPNSKFAALGLKKGDLIIKANNKRLRSYKDAFDIYKKVGKLDEISIVVLRNNQEKELVYEINR